MESDNFRFPKGNFFVFFKLFVSHPKRKFDDTSSPNIPHFHPIRETIAEINSIAAIRIFILLTTLIEKEFFTKFFIF